MIKMIAIAAIAAGACVAAPAFAEEVGVTVAPAAGVTVGAAPVERERSTTVIKEREPTDKTVIIKKDHDRDYDTREKVIIDR